MHDTLGADSLVEFQCTDHHTGAKKIFCLKKETSGCEWKFWVFASKQPKRQTEFYYACFCKELGMDYVQPTALYNNDVQGKHGLKGKGITEALFQEVMRLSGCKPVVFQ